MTYKNFEEIFQLIKDEITKESTKLRELTLRRLSRAATIGFLFTGELCISYVYEYYCSYSTTNSSTFTLRFRLFHLFLL